MADASAILADNADCTILAGGSDLLVQMRGGHVQPQCIVDIKAIPGIQDVTLTERGLTLGAAAPAQSITEREDIQALFPGLAEAIDLI